jgi:hypothetical protein
MRFFFLISAGPLVIEEVCPPLFCAPDFLCFSFSIFFVSLLTWHQQHGGCTACAGGPRVPHPRHQGGSQ